jgi:hypothetical protein
MKSTDIVIAAVFRDRCFTRRHDTTNHKNQRVNLMCSTDMLVHGYYENILNFPGSVLPRHENAQPYSAMSSQQLLQHIIWEILELLSYSPDLTCSNYHLFPSLDRYLGGVGFQVR